MAQLLGLEWDGREARVALAQRRGNDVVLEHAFAVDLSSGEGATDADIGQRILAALSARHIGRCDTLVAVGRSRIELRALSLPPAPVEELPDLVRFQALRQFAAIGEDWPVDFVHLATGDEESLTVLAAAISPEMVEQIRATCSGASQTPKRLVLRPFAAASLLRRRIRDDGCRLLIDLLAEEADLTVIADRQLVFMRTVRLPENENARQVALMGEIRRTTVAAQNQLGGRRVEEIVLCGAEQEHAALQSRLAESLDLPIRLFDPFADVRLGGELSAGPPANPGRFAPLVGMLLDECGGAAHAIDFLHPRQRPRGQSKHRVFAIAGAGIAAVVLLAVGLLYYQYWSMGRQIAAAQVKYNGLQKQEEAANDAMARVAKIDAWSKSDVVWLDELRYLSANFPPPEEIIVRQFDSLADGRTEIEGRTIGGRTMLDCAAMDSTIGRELEIKLSDKRHEFEGSSGATNDPRLASYSWTIKKVVSVTAATPEEQAAASSAASSEPAGDEAATPPDNISAEAERPAASRQASTSGAEGGRS